MENITNNLENLYFCKIHKQNSNIDKKDQNISTIIGVIDGSGSMTCAWPRICIAWNNIVDKLNNTDIHTIVFSNSAKRIGTNKITEKDCNGGTNIMSGINEAIKIIKEEFSNDKKNFTIIFVSDGEDNCKDLIKPKIKDLENVSETYNVTVNLICVGIGKSFPTFVAMDLRMKLHSGSSSIPAVFLCMDYLGQDTIETLDSILNNYCTSYKKLQLGDNLYKFPWNLENKVNKEDISSKVVYEESWFLSLSRIYYCNLDKKNNIIAYFNNDIDINSNKFVNNEQCCDFECLSYKDLSKQDIENVFKIWTQEIQLKTLNKSNESINNNEEIKEYSKICYNIMINIYNYFKYSQDECIKKIGNVKKQTVLGRIKLKESTSGNHILLNYISEIKNLMNGDSLFNLKPEEAAKRLAIGTEKGKYHNRALQMRGLTNEKFKEILKEFTTIIENNKIKYSKSSQESSVILLQNQKEILMEDDLLQIFKNKNILPYDIVEAFPLVGNTLNIYRTSGSMINPFIIKVNSIPKINTVCDTVSLITQGNEMEISIGNDEEETFNSVIPLYSNCCEDQELKPFLRSSFFHLLMTFNCMRNIDTLYIDAFYGLLSSTFLKLLDSQKSEWRDNLISKLYDTTEMVYKDTSILEKSLNYCINNPRQCVVTESIDNMHKCEDISKILLNMLILKNRNVLNNEKLLQILKYAYVEGVSRLLKSNVEIFELTTQDIQNNLTADYIENYNTFNNENKQESNNITSIKNSKNINSDKDIKESINFNYTNTNNNLSEVDIIDDNLMNKLNYIVDIYMKDSKYLIYDSIGKIKKDLKFVFNKFIEEQKNSNKVYVKCNISSINHPKSRINLSILSKAYRYFAEENVTDELLLTSLYHGYIYNSSRERSQNNIESDVDKVKTALIKKLSESNSIKKEQILYEKFEKQIVDKYLNNQNTLKQQLKSFNLNNDILSLEAAVIDANKPTIKVLFIGLEGCGKSTIVGKILEQTGYINNKLFDNFTQSYQLYYKNKSNKPYEWLSDTSLNERVLGKSIQNNYLLTKVDDKNISLIDSPGKTKYYREVVRIMPYVDHAFIVLESDKKYFDNNLDKIIDLILLQIACKSNNIKCINIVLSKIDLYYNNSSDVEQFIDYIKKIIHYNILEKRNINIDFVYIPISVYNNINISNILVNEKFNFKKYPNLMNYIKSLNNDNTIISETFTNNPKFITLKVNNSVKHRNLVYGIVLNGYIKVNQNFIVKGCNNEIGEVLKIENNYENLDCAKSGDIVSLKIKNLDSINKYIRSGMIFDFNVKVNDSINQAQKALENIIAEIKIFDNSISFDNGSVHQIIYKSLITQLEVYKINKVLDKKGNVLDVYKFSCSKDKKKFLNKTIIIVMIPIKKKDYLENVFINLKNSESFIIKSNNSNKLLACGNILNIEYK